MAMADTNTNLVVIMAVTNARIASRIVITMKMMVNDNPYIEEHTY